MSCEKFPNFIKFHQISRLSIHSSLTIIITRLIILKNDNHIRKSQRKEIFLGGKDFLATKIKFGTCRNFTNKNHSLSKLIKNTLQPLRQFIQGILTIRLTY